MHRMITMHSADGQTNIMAIAQRFVLTNANYTLWNVKIRHFSQKQCASTA